MRIPSLVLFSASLALCALACNSESELDCDQGEAYEVGEETYCVYSQAVTETGFECPNSVPNRHESASFTVCSGRTEIPPQQLDEVEVVVARDRGEQPQVLTPDAPMMENGESDMDQTPVQAPLFQINGDVQVDAATTAPAEGTYKVQAIWQVSSGSPDYLYAFGQGSATIAPQGSSFSMDFTTPPPAEALNSYGVGVGVIFGLFDSGAVLTDGMYSGEFIEDASLVSQAATDRYAIIYVAPGAALDDLGWTADFTEGYSCGRGVDAASGELFDSYEPVSCDQVVLRIAEMFDFVNWT